MNLEADVPQQQKITPGARRPHQLKLQFAQAQIRQQKIGKPFLVCVSVYSGNDLCPLISLKHHLNTTAYLSVVAYLVHLSMTIVQSSSDSRKTHRVTKVKSSQTGFFTMTVSHQISIQ